MGIASLGGQVRVTTAKNGIVSRPALLWLRNAISDNFFFLKKKGERDRQVHDTSLPR